MRNQIFKRLALAIAIGAAGVSVSQVALASHAWGNYHWARTTPQFTLKLGNNLTTTAWRSRLTQASNDWNAGNSPVLTAIVTGGTTSQTCKMVAGTTQVCNATYGANGWLGLASINISGSHITQGTAKMNDTYFNTATYNNVNEREHVMCQEVAHTFGLAHQSEDGSSQNSCMDYFSNTGANATSTVSTKPNAHDFSMLNSIYSHLDSTTTVASTPGATGSAAAGGVNVDISDDPASWGALMKQSANGRSSTYQRFNDDGSQTLTHVYWTNETAANCPSCDHRRQYRDEH
jgi:hypothetical protein